MLAHIASRCRAFFALPFDRLDREQLKHELDRIGTQYAGVRNVRASPQPRPRVVRPALNGTVASEYKPRILQLYGSTRERSFSRYLPASISAQSECRYAARLHQDGLPTLVRISNDQRS